MSKLATSRFYGQARANETGHIYVLTAFGHVVGLAGNRAFIDSVGGVARTFRPNRNGLTGDPRQRDGWTRDGVGWHIGSEVISCTGGSKPWRYSGYSLREALAEYRVEYMVQS